MNKPDGFSETSLGVTALPARCIPAPRFDALSLRHHIFVDYATQGYVALIGLLVLLAYDESALMKWSLVAAHLFCLAAIQALIRANARYPQNRALGFLRHFYPILLYTFFYREIGILDQTIVHTFTDAFFIRAEQRLFGCQPSIAFMEKLPYLPVSELFYMSYFSYYIMITGVGVCLYLKARNRFWEYISLMSFIFYCCYIFYICLPVAGSRVFYVPIADFDQTQVSQFPITYPPAVMAGPFFKIMAFIYRYVEEAGAAFPSSHVAIALCTLYFSWRFIPRIRWLHLLFVLLLSASTVYCRYHYLVDVFAGALTAAILIPVGEWLYRKTENHLARVRSRTV